MNGYATRDEAIQREIVEVIGKYADEHMIDAIADEVLTTTGAGTQYRYVMAVDADEFWEIVHRHAVDGEEPDGYDEAEVEDNQ